MTISLLSGEGHPGDPVQQRIENINTAFAQANVDIAAAVAAIVALAASFGAGSATLLNGQTSIVVTHGLDFTPAIGDVVVCPAEDVGAVTSFWVDTYTATEFTINVDQDPGADVDFAWHAQQIS